MPLRAACHQSATSGQQGVDRACAARNDASLPPRERRVTAQGGCMMGAITKTAFEVLLLAVLATAIGYTANAVRASGSIKWSKNYFDKGMPPGVPENAEPRPSPSQAM